MKKQSGFTFIELILYITLVSIFITSAVYFAWDIIYGQIRSGVQQAVSENIRATAQRIQAEIRNSQGIINLTPTSLELNNGSLGSTIVVFNGDEVEITQGGESYPLTSTQVEVTELLFFDRSAPDESSKNIEFTLTVRYKNPGQRKEMMETQTLQTSAEIRSD